MTDHQHFFAYSKEASTPTRFVTICRGCGEAKVTDVALTPSLPEPNFPSLPIAPDPWKRYPPFAPRPRTPLTLSDIIFDSTPID